MNKFGLHDFGWFQSNSQLVSYGFKRTHAVSGLNIKQTLFSDRSNRTNVWLQSNPRVVSCEFKTEPTCGLIRLYVLFHAEFRPNSYMVCCVLNRTHMRSQLIRYHVPGQVWRYKAISSWRSPPFILVWQLAEIDGGVLHRTTTEHPWTARQLVDPLSWNLAKMCPSPQCYFSQPWL